MGHNSKRFCIPHPQSVNSVFMQQQQQHISFYENNLLEISPFLTERHFCSAYTVIDRFGSSAASEENVVLCLGDNVVLFCVFVCGWVY